MRRQKESGAQAVEFALMLPFLILIIFLVVDFGFLIYNKAVITNAAREAARRGTVLTAAIWNADDVASLACDYTRSALITVSDGTKTDDCSGSDDPVITVNPAVTPPAFNDPVTVNVSYTFRGFLIGKPWDLGTTGAIGTTPITLTSTVEMLHE